MLVLSRKETTMKKCLTFFAIAALSIAAVSASAAFGNSADIKLVNTQEISPDGLNLIKATYISDHVTVYKSPSDKVILKEYMSKDEPRYYANVSQSKDSLTIRSGERPKLGIFTAFSAYAEIYLPEAYMGDFYVKNTSGSIEFVDKMALADVNIDITSGSAKLNDIAAKELEIETSSGAIKYNDIKASDVDITTNSGSIKGRDIVSDTSWIKSTSGGIAIGEISGKADLKTTSGSITFDCSADVGDVTVKSTSGRITVSVPKGLAFNFSANSTSGGIDAPFADKQSGSFKKVSTTVGTDPKISIDLSTTSGGIEVR